MKLTNEKAKQLKKDFPIFKSQKDLIYLDNAATSQKPREVLEAIKKFYETSNANISRGVYSLAETATKEYIKSREAVAKFLGADFKEIIFTKGTTDSLNSLALVIDSLIPEGKNEILLTEMEHHSNLIPWQQLAKRKNMKLKFIKLKSDFTLDLEDAKQKISDKTAVLAFTHVSNSLGIVNPVNELVKLAKKHNVLTVIDAAQSVPHMKIDVEKLDCDFLAFSGHKTLAGFGIGVLYGKKSLLEKLPPFSFGGGMIKSVSFTDFVPAEIPEKFEAGTPNVAGAVGLASAIKYLNKIGMENIENWEKELMKYLIKKLKELKNIEIYFNEKNYSGILSINLKGIHPHDVASILNDYGICVRAGHHCNMPLMKSLGIHQGGTIRISFYLYNTFEDIDALISGIEKVQEKFG